ncbi:protein asteroid homolog 1-like [Oppia nitens]|uniref:protein asteroid homolog 1-like n=1 Tax=Oppia nitens TaxID=1686743 RepID=UPI0023DA7591|nr:protein asteroid homolog 1-like [Oppia nitens]
MTTGHHLHDTYLVIDGNNLLYSLYSLVAITDNNDSNKNFIYGGDYSLFAGTVHRFFSTLITCSVRPVVVMDSCLDWSAEKSMKCFGHHFNSALQIATTSNADNNYRQTIGSSSTILPTLSRQVFYQVLDQLAIAYCQVRQDGDTYMVALANQLDCPVMTGDSDFFIYNIRSGVIHNDYLLMDSSMIVRQFEDRNNWRNRQTYKYLDTIIYKIDRLLNCFPGLTIDCLPVFSTLMGNDCVDYIHMKSIVSNDIPIDDSTDRTNKFLIQRNSYEKHRQMVKVLNWLRRQSRQQAIEFVQSILTDRSMTDLQKSVDVSIEKFTINNDDNNHTYETYFNRSTNSFNWTEMATKMMETSGMPLWRSNEWCKCHLTIMSTSSRIEDLGLVSTYQCSWKLKQYVYALKIVDKDDNDDDNGMDGEAVDDNVEPMVLFLDRYENSLKEFRLKPMFALTKSGRPVPKPTEINDLTITEKYELISEMLFDDKDQLQSIIDQTRRRLTGLQTDEELVFLMIVIRYWLANTPNQIWYEFMYSLIICILFTGHFTYDDNDYHNYQPLKLISTVSGKQTKDFLNSMNRPLNGSEQPFIPRIVHFYNEFQNCLTDIRTINTELQSPLPMGCSPDICLCGSFIYTLTKKLSQTNDPVSYLKGKLDPIGSTNYWQLIDSFMQIAVTNNNNDSINDKLIKCPQDFCR